MLRGSYPIKTSIISLAFIFIISFVTGANAATVYWTGSGDAGIAANWSGSQVPGQGDDVVFNNSSSENCTWDIPFTAKINSFTMDTGYSGTVSLDEGLNIGTGGINISSGILEAHNKIIELEGDWFYVSDQPIPLGDIDGDGSVDAADVSLIFNMAAGSEIFYCSDINFDSDVDILDVVLAQRKFLNIDSQTRKCTGGLFKPGTSTVKLTGTSQTIFGNTVFYNLEKTGKCPGDCKIRPNSNTQSGVSRTPNPIELEQQIRK